MVTQSQETAPSTAAVRAHLEWLLLGKIQQMSDADLIGGVNVRIDPEPPRPTVDLTWDNGRRRYYATVTGKHHVPEVIESR